MRLLIILLLGVGITTSSCSKEEEPVGIQPQVRCDAVQGPYSARIAFFIAPTYNHPIWPPHVLTHNGDTLQLSTIPITPSHSYNSMCFDSTAIPHTFTSTSTVFFPASLLWDEFCSIEETEVILYGSNNSKTYLVSLIRVNSCTEFMLY